MRRARPKPRAPQWVVEANNLTRENRRLDVDHVLDVFDELADLYEWGGDKRDAAEHRAWNDTVELLCPTP